MQAAPRTVLATLLLGVLALGAGAGRDGCRKCDGRGLAACKEHRKSDRGLEERTLWCSLVDGCDDCGGSGWVPCAACEDPAARDELDRRAALRAAIRAEMAERTETMGRALLAAETDHVRIVWEVGDHKVGSKRKSAHQAMHVYIDRLEETRARYCDLLGVDPEEGFDGKMEVYVWSDREDQLTCSREIIGVESDWPMQRLGKDPRLSVWYDKRFYDGDGDLHRAMVHHGAHLLLNSQVPPQMLSNLSAGWIDVGFAHWLEIDRFGTSDTFCFTTRPDEDPLSQKDWRRIVGDHVRRGDLPDPDVLLQKRGADLSRVEHALAFGIVDWVIAEDPARFELLARRLRTRLPARDAVRELFGRDVAGFWEDWQAWIRAEYPSR